MIVKKQYIPRKYRSKKLVNSGSGVSVGGASVSGSATLGSLVDTSAFLLADKFYSMFEYDEVNDAIKAKFPFYSEGEISAYGVGTGSGGGGGTGIVYNGLDSTITDIALSAYMGNVLNTTKLNVSTFNSWVSNYVPPAPAWGDVTGKPSTFPATAHTHRWGEIESKPTTFAPSAHTHSFWEIGSRPTTINGYGITDATRRASIGGTANSISSWDTRSVDEIPNTDRAEGMWLDFKSSSAIGLTGLGQGEYSGLLTILPYVDASGNGTAGGRIALSNGNLYVQQAQPTSYTNWKRIWDNNNLTSLSQLTDNIGVATHIANKANPHSVTKAQVGLGNVTNESKATMFTNPSFTGTATVQTDIITNFNTWTNGNSKSLDKFLKLFDIDTAGNLVVKTNLYSTGEVTAYSSGTGVSGLKLMGDLDANGKNITNVGEISSLYGLALKTGDTTWLALGDDGVHYILGSVEGLTSLETVNLFASTRVTAPEFKFGSWTFKQDASGRLGIYNGATEVACFNTDGTYVNL